MSRITDPSFKFWYDDKWYTVQGAETMVRMGTKDDMSTMLSEYTRMRDTAQKRIKRLEKLFPESSSVKNHPKGFPKLKDIDPRDFPKAFSELAKFLKAKGSTVTGQRQIKEKTIKTWQAQGINLNPKSYDKTIRILEEMRRQKIVYGSDKAVELADSMLELDDQQTNKWLDHLDVLLRNSNDVNKLVKKLPTIRGVDFDEILALLGE
jgi:hypothetical protein